MTALSMQQVIVATARYFRVSQAELISQSRHRYVTRPRQVAMYLGRELTPRSLPQIGQRLGGRDHTTVLHGWRRITALAREDLEIARAVRRLTAELTGAGGRPTFPVAPEETHP